MSDRYIDFANSFLGQRLVAAIGLPSPVRLERWQAGRLRPVDGALLLGGGLGVLGLIVLRRRRPAAAAGKDADLSAEERARLAQLLNNAAPQRPADQTKADR